MLLVLLIALFAVAVQSQDTLALTIITWNTEYYFPKLGDFNALIKANGHTIDSTCKSDMVVFLLQEVGEGYLDATCGSYDSAFARQMQSADAKKVFTEAKKMNVFKNVRHGMEQFLRTECSSDGVAVDYDVSCKNMHGFFGTKTKGKGLGKLPSYNKGRVNSQIAVVFNKNPMGGQPKYDIDIHERNTFNGILQTEKGGVIVTIKTHGKDTPKAAVIGVHLDSTKAKTRNQQICRIMKKLVNVAAKKEAKTPLAKWPSQFYHQNNHIHEWVVGEYKCKKHHSDQIIMYALGTMVTELYPMGVFWTGDSNYRLPITTFDLVQSTDCVSKKKKDGTSKLIDCEQGKKKVIRSLAKLGCGDQETLAKYEDNDTWSLKDSALTYMGATVNKPYPKFPPSYPYPRMQPHQVLKAPYLSTLDHPDIEGNSKAVALVAAWQDGTGEGGGCKPNVILTSLNREISYPILETAIEDAITFTEDEAMKVKGKGETVALNIGYLDRLFILNNNKVTTIERDLEVQAMLYGGDHLPQLFHVIATSVSNQVIYRPAYERKEIPLELATTQLFTTTPLETASIPGDEYSPHVGFGTSNLEKPRRITKSSINLRANDNKGDSIDATSNLRANSIDSSQYETKTSKKLPIDNVSF